MNPVLDVTVACNYLRNIIHVLHVLTVDVFSDASWQRSLLHCLIITFYRDFSVCIGFGELDSFSRRWSVWREREKSNRSCNFFFWMWVSRVFALLAQNYHDATVQHGRCHQQLISMYPLYGGGQMHSFVALISDLKQRVCFCRSCGGLFTCDKLLLRRLTETEDR